MNESKLNRDIEIFERMPVPAAVRVMAVPTVISQLIVLIYNIADTFFIGQTNNPYMVASASLILPLFNITLSLSSLSGTGGGALISRLLGLQQRDEARKVFSFSTYLGLLLSALFSSLTLRYMTPLMYFLGAGPETFDFARGYAFFVIVCGAVPTVMSTTLSNLIRSVGESKKAGFGITLGGVINIILDPIIMFGILPDGMEIVGAGIATFLSNCIACTYFIVVLVRQSKTEPVLRLAPPSSLPSPQNVGGIFNVGVPAAVATFLFDIDYIVIDRLMSGYSDLALAAVGIVLKAERLPLNVGIGICQGMVPIVAYNYSSGNRARMNETRRFSLKLGLICAALSIALYELCAGLIMGIFIKDAETVALGTVFLRIRVLATPLMFLSFFHVHLFNGFGKGGYALFLGVMRWLVFNIPMLFLLNRLVGMYGIVWSQVAADILTVLLSFAVYRFYEKRHLDVLPPKADPTLSDL